jgi:hypothetical protein
MTANMVIYILNIDTPQLRRQKVHKFEKKLCTFAEFYAKLCNIKNIFYVKLSNKKLRNNGFYNTMTALSYNQIIDLYHGNDIERDFGITDQMVDNQVTEFGRFQITITAHTARFMSYFLLFPRDQLDDMRTMLNNIIQGSYEVWKRSSEAEQMLEIIRLYLITEYYYTFPDQYIDLISEFMNTETIYQLNPNSPRNYITIIHRFAKEPFEIMSSILIADELHLAYPTF